LFRWDFPDSGAARWCNFLANPGGFAYSGFMSTIETISIDVYPWAAPTDEQRAWFDALSPDAKRKAILEAIEEGFNGPASSKSIDEVIREARADFPHAP
jgi:hypothetical protein